MPGTHIGGSILNRTILLATALSLALPLAISAQQPAKPAANAPSQKLIDTVDVRVINVDVVVTDKKGNPVRGLTKDDFVIFENGVEKPLSNFYAVDAAQPATTATATPGSPATASAAAAPIDDNLRRRIILYVDNLSLAPFNRNKVFAQMKEFIKMSMRRGDEAMIATFNRSMKVRMPFTRDQKALIGMLDEIAGESAMGSSNNSEREQIRSRIRESSSYEDAAATARTYAASVEHDNRQSVASLNALMSTLAGVEGKKILVLTSEGFQMQPGREVFLYLDEYSREKGSGWSTGSAMLEGMNYDASNLIQSVAKTANANSITLYTIHAGGLGAANDNSAENAAPVSFTVQQAAVTNSTESLRQIADMTGGLSATSTNNYAQAFKNILNDLDSYYSLGYRASSDRSDRQRELDVRLKTPNRNYIVRSRQTFVEKSPFTEMNDRVIANLLYKTKSNDMKIVVKINAPIPQDDDLFKVPVEIQVPLDSITFLPQGDSYAGSFSVYVAVADKNSDMSDVSRRTQEVHIPEAEFAGSRGKYYTFTLDLLTESGLNKISIGVVDEVSTTTGFAREQVIAKDLR
jgi:VWFA-related protein